MGNKRVYEFAKEVNQSSKDVVEKAQTLGIDVKNQNSMERARRTTQISRIEKEIKN